MNKSQKHKDKKSKQPEEPAPEDSEVEDSEIEEPEDRDAVKLYFASHQDPSALGKLPVPDWKSFKYSSTAEWTAAKSSYAGSAVVLRKKCPPHGGYCDFRVFELDPQPAWWRKIKESPTMFEFVERPGREQPPSRAADPRIGMKAKSQRLNGQMEAYALHPGEVDVTRVAQNLHYGSTLLLAYHTDTEGMSIAPDLTPISCFLLVFPSWSKIPSLPSAINLIPAL